MVDASERCEWERMRAGEVDKSLVVYSFLCSESELVMTVKHYQN